MLHVRRPLAERLAVAVAATDRDHAAVGQQDGVLMAPAGVHGRPRPPAVVLARLVEDGRAAMRLELRVVADAADVHHAR